MVKIASVIGATGYVGSAVIKSLCENGFSVRAASRNPTSASWLSSLGDEGKVEIFPLTLKNQSNVSSLEQLRGLMRGSEMAFFCAGFEEQSPSTIDFMVNNVKDVIKIAKSENVKTVVLTSSGGSTNPAGLSDSMPKSELLHFSDPDDQIAKGKFSPAAKTLMERAAFEAVGRNHNNEIVDSALASSSPRLCIMVPNLILGPHLDPGSVKGNSLPWMIKILKKERMSEFIPNDSMSIIDIRDLADLHVAAALNEDASGRYFGVNRSFPWREILNCFGEVLEKYTPPSEKEGEDYDGKIATQFDHSRKESLGVELRELKETLKDLVEYFKSKDAL